MVKLSTRGGVIKWSYCYHPEFDSPIIAHHEVHQFTVTSYLLQEETTYFLSVNVVEWEGQAHGIFLMGFGGAHIL